MRSPVVMKLLCAALIAFLLLPGVPSLAAPPPPPDVASAADALSQLESEAGDVQVSLKRGLGTASQ